MKTEKKINLFLIMNKMNFITYTCTNHPEVILDKPGVCPKCGKVLVKKY